MDVETKAQVRGRIGLLHLLHVKVSPVSALLARRYLDSASQLAAALSPRDVSDHVWYRSVRAGLEQLARIEGEQPKQAGESVPLSEKLKAFVKALEESSSAMHKDVRVIAEKFKKLRRRCFHFVTFVCVRLSP